MLIIAGREARVIPRGWEHPRNKHGHHLGLMSDWAAALRERTEHPERYGPGSDEPPLVRGHYMPDVARLAPEATQIAAYETISDGTPMSPAFDNTPEGKLALLTWCAEHCSLPGTLDGRTGIEAWAAILFGSALIDPTTGSVSA